MAEAEALPLDPVFAAAHRRQQQVGDVVVKQVELVDVEHTPMGFGQQPWLKNSLATGQRSRHIDRAHQPVFGNAQRHLHEGRRHHCGGQQGAGIGARGIGSQFGEPNAGCLVPVIGPLGIDVEGLAAHIEHVDRRQQGVQTASQHRLPSATTTGDHHPAQAWIDRGQQQGQLEGAVAGDGGEGKGPTGNSACNHGRAKTRFTCQPVSLISPEAVKRQPWPSP